MVETSPVAGLVRGRERSAARRGGRSGDPRQFASGTSPAREQRRAGGALRAPFDRFDSPYYSDSGRVEKCCAALWRLQGASVRTSSAPLRDAVGSVPARSKRPLSVAVQRAATAPGRV